MRKVILTMYENQKYLAIKKLVETNGDKKRAALFSCNILHEAACNYISPLNI